MSLKAVHLAFICASALLAAGFSAWCFREMARTGDLAPGAAGVISAAAAVALGLYAIRFVRKSRDIGYL